MRAVQSLVAENHTIPAIFPILCTLDILQPLKLSFSQVKLVIYFSEKSHVVTFWQCIVAAWEIRGGSWRASFPARAEGTGERGAGFSSIELIWIQSAESIYPEVNGHRHSAFQGLELFQKEMFMLVALHKCTLQKCIWAQKREARVGGTT